MRKIYMFFGATMPEQQRSLKGVGISFLLVVAVLVFILSGCSINIERTICFVPVSSVADVEDLPLQKHDVHEDGSWSDEIKKFKVNVDNFTFTKNCETMNRKIIDKYRKAFPMDIVLEQNGVDGKILVRIWTNGHEGNINTKFATMKK